MGFLLLMIGFLLVKYPILLLIKIWSMPAYVIISCFLWIGCMLGWICIGKKRDKIDRILPIITMMFIFTFIYASGYSKIDSEEEDLSILLTPILSTPAFCYIGYKMEEYRQNRKIEQMHVWIKSLNECYNKKIEGSNKIITLIQSAYSDGKQIEKLLNLLDVCSGNNLQVCFGKRIVVLNQDLLVQIQDIVSMYSLAVYLENKTLGEILKEMQRLESKYRGKIYDEKQVVIDCYNKIKKEFNEVCYKKDNIVS